MDETTHRNLMQLSATSRVATADLSGFTPESPVGAAADEALPLSERLEMGLETLLSQFRRR